jgi:hypothetical protein
MDNPVELFQRLVAAGDISAADGALLIADWQSFERSAEQSAPAGASGLEENEYWSLRLLRDLACALSPGGVDLTIECALHSHEQCLADALHVELSRPRRLP